MATVFSGQEGTEQISNPALQSWHCLMPMTLLPCLPSLCRRQNGAGCQVHFPPKKEKKSGRWHPSIPESRQRVVQGSSESVKGSFLQASFPSTSVSLGLRAQAVVAPWQCRAESCPGPTAPRWTDLESRAAQCSTAYRQPPLSL